MAPPPPVPEKDADLWAMYANKVKEMFLSGSPLGETNKLYIPLLNTNGPMVGGDVLPTTTLYDVAKLGDSLITYDNPMFTPGDDKYSSMVYDYLCSVQLETHSGAGNKRKLKEATKAVDEAQTEYNAAVTAAGKAFETASKDHPDMEFATWVTHNYPSLDVKHSELAGATSNYDQIALIVYGTGYKPLQEHKEHMKDALDAVNKTHYNMQVSPPLFGPEDEVEDTGKQYAPSYALDSSYAATIEDWMNTYNDPTHKNVSIKVSSEECSDYKWSDVGHQEWSANSGGRYIPFFSINYDSSNSKDDTIINADKEDASVEMSINAAAVQTFPIQPGSWDTGDVKKQYPNLVPGSSKHLWDPMFRVSSLIVGYAVDLEVKMNKHLYHKVTTSLREAQSHEGSVSATFFGFRINLGGGGSYSSTNETNYSDVKTDDEAYSMTIPGSNNNIPILLAVVATEVAPATKKEENESSV